MCQLGLPVPQPSSDGEKPKTERRSDRTGHGKVAGPVGCQGHAGLDAHGARRKETPVEEPVVDGENETCLTLPPGAMIALAMIVMMAMLILIRLRDERQP